MLEWSYNQNEHQVANRVPFRPLTTTGIEDKTNYSKLNKFQVLERGHKVAIIGLGTFFELGEKVKTEIKSKLGINATLINPKFITGIDKELLEDLKSDHDIVITLEDGILNGGFGEKIASFYGNSDMKVLNYGAFKEFTDRIPLDELYERYRLKKELITEDISKLV